MEAVFLSVMNLSITASYIALAVMLIRLVLKRAPRWISCVMWGMVALRLIMPFTLECVLSLIPSSKPLPDDFIYAAEPQINSGIPYINSIVNPILSESMAPAELVSANPSQLWSLTFSIVWVIGIIIMLSYAVISYIRLYRRVSDAVKLKDNIYVSEKVDSPFVLGAIRPGIYLPVGMSEEDEMQVIRHERSHLSRLDHLWKPLGFLLLSVHWFNPIMWAAYILLCRDIESACDEKVIKAMGEDEKKAYSYALLNCSIHRRAVTACPLAFGETGVRSRIKRVMNYKKPAFWLIIIAVCALVILAVCFLTDPLSETPELPDITAHSYAVSEVIYQSPVYSFFMIAGENTPIYALTDDMELMIKGDLFLSDEWTAFGRLAKVKLDKDSFDDMFVLSSQADLVLSDAVSVWAVDDGKIGYYLIRQSSGELFLVRTSLHGEKGAEARFLYRLTEDIGSDMGVLAVSGGNSCDVKVYPSGTDISTIVSKLSSVVISPSEEDTVPVKLMCDGNEIIASYRIYDAQTLEPLDFFTPSGLAPQTYLFTNAKAGCRYIITASTDPMAVGGDMYCFIAVLPQPEYTELTYEDIVLSDDVKDMPAPVIEYALSLVLSRVEEYNGFSESNKIITGHTYTVTDAVIDSIELMPTGTSALGESVNMYRMVCRLKPSQAENVFLAGGMLLEDGWFVITDPYFVLLCEDLGDDTRWTRLGTVASQALIDYQTPEMLDRYGNEYTAAAMELLLAYREGEGHFFSDGWFESFVGEDGRNYHIYKKKCYECGYIYSAQYKCKNYTSLCEGGCIEHWQDAKLTGVYYMKEFGGVSSPSVALFDDGSFTFSYDEYRNYHGHGTYDVDNGRLTLNVNGDENTYVFDVSGSSLVFDADASSDIPLDSGITDGAIFE